MVTIQLDEDKVREIAYDLSQKPMSYDEFVWLFAENDLKLHSAVAGDQIFQECGTSKCAEIDPNAIVDQPSEDEIRNLAYDISQKGISPQDLHWLIAERLYLCDTAKNM
jgi:hypothetical protein